MRKVEWTRPALKDTNRLNEPTRRRIYEAVQRLSDTGLGDVVRLKDTDPPEYRLRVGDWRIRYTEDDLFDHETGQLLRTIFILRVLPRDRAYRD